MKRWPLNRSWFWEENPFFRLLLPLLAGIICYEYGWIHISSGPGILTVFLTLLIALLFFHLVQKAGKFLVLFQFITVLLTFIFLGYGVSYLFDARNNPKWFGNHFSNAEAFTARIISEPQERERTWKFKVELENVLVEDLMKPVSGKAWIYTYKTGKPCSFNKGETILLPSRWESIKNAGNPNEFNYARYAKWQNLFYLQFLNENQIRVIKKADPENFSWTERCHDWSMAQLEKYILDTSTLGLIQAMLIGDEMNLDPELRQQYSATGIVHIIAISGGHVVVFFSIVSAFFFWLRNRKYLWIKYAAAVPLVWFYVMMAGAPPSAIRAAVMFTIIGLGIILRKDANPLNILLGTAFCILLFQPFWLFAIGFQLSFVAVLSLILFYKPIRKLYTPPHIIIRKTWEVIAASLAAELLIAPIVIYYFHLFPAAFLIANVFAILFMGAAISLGMGIVLLSWWSPLALFLAWLVTGITIFFNRIVSWLQDLNPDSFRHLQIDFIQLLALYVIIGCFAFFIKNRNKASWIAGWSLVCLFLVHALIIEMKINKQEKLVVYNLSHANRVEYIKGKTYYVLFTDTILKQPTIDFATKECHETWHAWHKGIMTPKDLFIIAGKKFLILNQSLEESTLPVFPVDYVLINYPVRYFHAQKIQKIFQPQKIIFGSNQKRYVAQQWKDSCLKYKIAFHATALDGAFVFSNQNPY